MMGGQTTTMSSRVIASVQQDQQYVEKYDCITTMLSIIATDWFQYHHLAFL